MVGVKVGEGVDSNQAEDHLASTTLTVSGMTCGHCQAKVERALQGVAGVYSATVDRTAGVAEVESADSVSPAELIAAVERAGYRAGVPA